MSLLGHMTAKQADFTYVDTHSGGPNVSSRQKSNLPVFTKQTWCRSSPLNRLGALRLVCAGSHAAPKPSLWNPGASWRNSFKALLFCFSSLQPGLGKVGREWSGLTAPGDPASRPESRHGRTRKHKKSSRGMEGPFVEPRQFLSARRSVNEGQAQALQCLGSPGLALRWLRTGFGSCPGLGAADLRSSLGRRTRPSSLKLAKKCRRPSCPAKLAQ